MAQSMGQNDIVACSVSYGHQLMGITESGCEHNLGSFGEPITNIINAANHAIITLESGVRIKHTFSSGAQRNI